MQKDEVLEHLNYALAHAESLCHALKFVMDNIRQPDFSSDDLAQNANALNEKVADVQRYLDSAFKAGQRSEGRPGRIPNLDRGYDSLENEEWDMLKKGV